MNTELTLSKDYVTRSRKRLRILDVLLEEESWCDVVRESQEIVELLLKGLLRFYGIDPPKWHDVGPVLAQHAHILSPDLNANLDEIVKLSLRLRKERETSFYGDLDLLPSESFSREDAITVSEKTRWLVALVEKEVCP